ncbi:MAG TPA: FAD-dependent oxidoreductase [Burkholderiales bacterium]|nr:FAD-dependent oxidoreductase [Burkholderiales bacterium]
MQHQNFDHYLIKKKAIHIMDNQPVYIIGAGIAGMGAAHMLHQRGYRTITLESGEQPGGRAGFHRQDGFCFETGGKNFSSGHPIINGFLNEFGLVDRDVQHASFHIVMDGALQGFDKNRTLTGDLSLAKALGLRGALQFKKLIDTAFKHADKLHHAGNFIERFEWEHDHEPISAQFSQRLADGPLRMFSIIMGAAEPEETYYSSLLLFLAGFRAGSHHAIPGGIGKLFDGLSAGKEIRYGVSVRKIIVRRNRVCGLLVRDGASERVIETERVISAVPLHALRNMLDMSQEADAAASRIRYFPLALVNAVYDEDVFDDKMSSIMFDKRAHIGHCSANRLYQKNVVRFTLSGKRAREVLHLSDRELIDIAERDFKAIWPIRGKREYFHVQRHAGGICAYAPHFSRVRRSLLSYFDGIKGFGAAGDYLEGHHMEGCLQSAQRAVERVVSESADLRELAFTKGVRGCEEIVASGPLSSREAQAYE